MSYIFIWSNPATANTNNTTANQIAGKYKSLIPKSIMITAIIPAKILKNFMFFLFFKVIFFILPPPCRNLFEYDFVDCIPIFFRDMYIKSDVPTLSRQNAGKFSEIQ